MKIFQKCVFLLCISFVLVACGGGGDSSTSTVNNLTSDEVASDTQSNSETSTLPDGRLIYMEPQTDGNTFACAHCHALSEPSEEGYTRPGHPIGDALRRPSFKNGELPNLIDAVNVCLDVWMAVPIPWIESTTQYIALTDFLAEREAEQNQPRNEVATALTFSKADPITFTNNGEVEGDIVLGRSVFNETCILCHGKDAEGTERAPSLLGRFTFEGAANFIAQKVRLSGPNDHAIYDGDSVGGRMPFWAEDRMNNQDLEHVIAFLLASEFPDEVMDTTTTNNNSDSQCTSTHSKIGQTTELITRAHQVSGTATIVDDCTIRIDNFNFDGGGIDVRAYAGEGVNFSDAFTMGDNLVNNRGYDDTTLTVTLPEGKTLDDFDRISIWCIPIGLSFGDGVFE